jgi:hypothetical protein
LRQNFAMAVEKRICKIKKKLKKEATLNICGALKYLLDIVQQDVTDY